MTRKPTWIKTQTEALSAKELIVWCLFSMIDGGADDQAAWNY
jgi:hypothetical protein